MPTNENASSPSTIARLDTALTAADHHLSKYSRAPGTDPAANAEALYGALRDLCNAVQAIAEHVLTQTTNI